MQYTQLGNTGLLVSRLSFGVMTFSQDPSLESIFKVDHNVAQGMIDRCLDAGINFFDTADAYAGGKSEEMLAETLGPRRKDVIVATKVGFRTGTPITQAGLSRTHIMNSCEASLRRLKTDYIDLYICHREDPFTPLEETLSALNDLVRQGKVRYLGFSNWSAWKVALALQMQERHGWAKFCSGQLFYSLVERGVETDLLPMMEYTGLKATVWSPLAGGFLSGKYTPETLQDKDNRLSGFDVLIFDKAKGFQIVDAMRGIAEAHGASVAQVALAWLLARPIVGSVLIGATKQSQLEDNLRAIELTLSPAELAQLDELSAVPPLYPHWFIQNFADQTHAQQLR